MLLTPVFLDVGYKVPSEAKESSIPMHSMLAKPQNHSTFPAPSLYFDAVFALAEATRTPKRVDFLNRRTLNRSKSVRARLRSTWTLFLAQALSCHFASIPAFSHAFWTAPVRAPRGSFARTRGVRTRWARATA